MRRIVFLLAFLASDAAWAITVTPGADLTNINYGEAQVDSDYKHKYSEERAMCLAMPGNNTCVDVQGGDQVTVTPTDICGATPTANLPLCLDGSAKIPASVIPDLSGTYAPAYAAPAAVACPPAHTCSGKTDTTSSTTTATGTGTFYATKTVPLSMTYTNTSTFNATNVSKVSVLSGLVTATATLGATDVGAAPSWAAPAAIKCPAASTCAGKTDSTSSTTTATGTGTFYATTATPVSMTYTNTSTFSSASTLAKMSIASGLVTATAIASATDIGALGTNTITSTLAVQKVAVQNGAVTAVGTATASDVGAVATNTAITPSGATNKIVQYDAKGLVLSGADATPANIGAVSSSSCVTMNALLKQGGGCSNILEDGTLAYIQEPIVLGNGTTRPTVQLYVYPDSSNNAYLFSPNAWFSGGLWKYLTNGPAGRLDYENGVWNIVTAASGTAGGAVSWSNSLSLDNSSNLTGYGNAQFPSLTIGSTGNGTPFDIYSTSSSGVLASLRGDFHANGHYGMIRFGDSTQTSNYQKGALIYKGINGSANGDMCIALNTATDSSSVALSDCKLTVANNGNTTITGSASANGSLLCQQNGGNCPSLATLGAAATGTCPGSQYVSAISTSGVTCSVPPTGVTGSGTTGSIAKFTSSTSVGNAVPGTDYLAPLGYTPMTTSGSNAASTAVDTDWLPDGSITRNLGSTAKPWATAYADVLSLGGSYGKPKILIYDDGTYVAGFGTYATDSMRVFSNDFDHLITFGSQTRAGVFTEGMRLASGVLSVVGNANANGSRLCQADGGGCPTPATIGALAADGATGTGCTSINTSAGKVTSCSTTAHLTANAVSCSGANTINATNGQITSCSTTSYLSGNSVSCSAGSNNFVATNGQITSCSTVNYLTNNGAGAVSGRKLVTSLAAGGRVDGVADMASSDVTTALGYTPMTTSGSNAASTAIAADWLPDATNTRQLGSTAKRWSTVDGVNGDFTGSMSVNSLSASGTVSGSNITAGGNTTGAAALNVLKSHSYNVQGISYAASTSTAYAGVGGWGTMHTHSLTTAAGTIEVSADVTFDLVTNPGLAPAAGDACCFKITVDGTQINGSYNSCLTITGPNPVVGMVHVQGVASVSAASHIVLVEGIGISGITTDLCRTQAGSVTTIIHNYGALP